MLDMMHCVHRYICSKSMAQVVLAVLPEALSVLLRPRDTERLCIHDDVDTNRLAELSRQTQCGLARDHCLGQLFGIQGEFVDHRFWLGDILLAFCTLSDFFFEGESCL